MSKNAIKKAAKAARLAALKLERRAREKEAKKEKKRVRAEKRAAGELDDVAEDDINRRMKRPKLQFGGTVVVDLGFDDMMNDKVSKHSDPPSS
jgi:tRNA (guanine9-N1)-methyltransferase